MTSILRSMARRLVPLPTRRFLGRVGQRVSRWPPVGGVDFGSLRRLTPISEDWGFDRGLPVDRYYVERFLASEAGRIRDRVLEIDTNDYTRRFGGDRVTRSDVLHISDMGPGVTIVGDLTQGDTLPPAAFDCVIVTQTLHLIYEVQAAVGTLHRILRPGGTALITVPGMSRMTRDPEGKWGYYWGFTSLSAERLFQESFPGGNLSVQTWGNVLSGSAFLFGLASSELTDGELTHTDPDFEVLVTVRATKAVSDP